ncbi:hypothetical protein RJ55_04587 [Drechmeria coniospora]|nr:hypothetical protein RJ55_04587 [Drechmeria coniospora]
MATLDDVVMADSQDEQYQPFTLEENINQLNAIDKSIVELMAHTATALNALTTPATTKTSDTTGEASRPPALDPASQKDAFRSATNSFLTLLHSIDVRMKRQVLALEEAGIVNLSNAQRQESPNTGTTVAPKASPQPNGVGDVGTLDVGWLNSRSTRVEREMEAEAWQDARELLERLKAKQTAENEG